MIDRSYKEFTMNEEENKKETAEKAKTVDIIAGVTGVIAGGIALWTWIDSKTARTKVSDLKTASAA